MGKLINVKIHTQSIAVSYHLQTTILLDKIMTLSWMIKLLSAPRVAAYYTWKYEEELNFFESENCVRFYPYRLMFVRENVWLI